MGGSIRASPHSALTEAARPIPPRCFPTINQVPSASNPAWVAFDLSAVPAARRPSLRLFYYDQWMNGQYNADVYGSCYNSYSGAAGCYALQTNTAPGGTGAVPGSGWTAVTSATNSSLSEVVFSLPNTSAVSWVRFLVTALSPCEQRTWFTAEFDFYNGQAPAASGTAFLGDSITFAVGLDRAMGRGYTFVGIPELLGIPMRVN